MPQRLAPHPVAGRDVEDVAEIGRIAEDLRKVAVATGEAGGDDGGEAEAAGFTGPYEMMMSATWLTGLAVNMTPETSEGHIICTLTAVPKRPSILWCLR